MGSDEVLALFEELASEVAEVLDRLDDWGLSGRRRGQYRHDLAADAVVVERLVGRGFSVVSEESGRVGQGPVTVVVDPVDGSTNGSRGLPWYATSLCAVDHDGPWVALVANLATGERYRAVRGEGVEMSTRSEGPFAAPPPSGCTDLSDAIIGFSGLPPAHGGWAQYRACGAAALDLCAVATGVFDGFVDVDRAHGPWDYLGALLVCREAGAPVVDSGGQDLVTLDPLARRGPVAAATPELLTSLIGMERAWHLDGPA